MDKQLRVLAAHIVVESNLSKSAKIQMLNFIKEEATDAQIKALLLDGKIVHLDEQAEDIVNERFSVSEAGGRVAKLRKTASSQMGQGYGTPVLWALYRKIRSIHDGCTKKCGTYESNTTRRQHCMIRCKVAKLESQLAAAKKHKNEKEINSISHKLMKAKNEFNKSQASFKQRGASENN